MTAAFELARLGFYCQTPLEVQRHAKRLPEEFGVVSIAELADDPDRAPISVAGIVTPLRVRTTNVIRFRPRRRSRPASPS